MNKRGKKNRSSDWKALCQRARVLTNNCAKLKRSLAKIPGSVRDAVRGNKLDSLCKDNVNYFKFKRDNYVEPLRTLVMAEHFYESIDARKYDQFDTPADIESSPATVSLRGLSKGLTSMARPELVVFEDPEEYKTVEVREFWHDVVELNSNLKAHPYNISFVSSLKEYKTIYEALDRAAEKRKGDWVNIRHLLFECPADAGDRPSKSKPKIDIPATDTDILKRRLENCNESQRQAIIAIMEAKCRPKPYILLGPPRSGKTFTIVELVVQLAQRVPDYPHILVCLNSDKCADEMAATLHATGLVESMARLCKDNSSRVTSYDEDKYSVREANLYSSKSIKGLVFQVFVTTIDMVRKFVHKKDWFDYIIIDDACQLHEAKTLIPINYMANDSCLVLVGDPKQLGPVVNCRQADQLGLGKSTLERLLELDLYRRHPEKGYDQKYITELEGSYSRDYRVFTTCNKLFYADRVECFGQTPDSLLEKLNLSHPLAFKPVFGREEENSGIISRCNPMEVDECVRLVIKLLKIGLKGRQIGVVTFYSYQAQEIEEKLRLELKSRVRELVEAQRDLPKDLDYARRVKKFYFDMTDDELIQHFEKMNNEDDEDIELSGEQERDNRMKEQFLFNRFHCKVNTVDRYQGVDTDVIIISTVRCPEQSSDSIENCKELSDSRRFNVAMSRAKWLTMVVGHPAVLNLDDNWREFSKEAVQYDE